MEGNNKISHEFLARIQQLKPKQEVRTVVLLNVPSSNAKRFRQNTRDRKRAIEEIRQSSSEAIGDVKGVLKRFNHKVSLTASSIGSITVEVPKEAIYALSSLDSVKAIMEDQEIMPSLTI